MSSGLLAFLKRNSDARKVFGERELKIIEKQLWGVGLTQSEKNRLSRDVRKKLEFIREVSQFADEFRLKKGAVLWSEIGEVLDTVRRDKSFNRIIRVWVFGSTVTAERTLSSDVDVAVEFKNVTPKEAVEFRSRVSGNFGENVDVQVYNTLPDKVRAEIKQNGRVVYEQKNG